VKFLLIDIPEVKIKVGQRGLPGIAQGNNILYDRGTEMGYQLNKGRETKKNKPEYTFP
jgi:hypothetical protein